MSQWYALHEMDHSLMEFAVLIAKYNNQFIIIHNKKRGGWEIPGGSREAGESILFTAGRELYEETGAVKFELTPFGIYLWRGNYGMVFYAEVEEINPLPAFEIEEIKFEDELPGGMNFGEMFYCFHDKWVETKDTLLMKYSIDIRSIDKTKELIIV